MTEEQINKMMNSKPKTSISKQRKDKWVKNVWKSDNGVVYEWVKWSDAEDFLIEQWQGEVKWAYSYEWDPVDLIWGKSNAETGWKWYWLKKIMEKHPEVKWRIQELINTLPRKNIWVDGVIVLDDGTSKVVIMENWKWQEKRWVLTAFDYTK